MPQGYVKPPRPVLLVDFDGTIADYSRGYQGPGHIGQPIEGAFEGLRQLKETGYYIVVWTCRSTVGLYEWFDQFNAASVYDEINFDKNGLNNEPKPFADYYLGDDCVFLQILCILGDAREKPGRSGRDTQWGLYTWQTVVNFLVSHRHRNQGAK